MKWDKNKDKDASEEVGIGTSNKKDPVTICLFSYNDADILSSQLKAKTIIFKHQRIVKEKTNLKGTPVLIGLIYGYYGCCCELVAANVEEIDLCFLQVDDHGTLTVIPDFTKRKSYIFMNSRSVSAKSFLSSDIFVHYLVMLPKGCTSNVLEGVTETCSCKTKNEVKQLKTSILGKLNQLL
ncbi:hypothetical protein TNCT_410831 [Trichonephila clavata]|uniref:Uncharacterized protein n=1 Tax=Trichonephila clavata TaxID=2740835 RepID=A0A8X6G0X4_TRICU|nr:hypothetical protein TNCT_410831 [Trichonephila clavata]